MRLRILNAEPENYSPRARAVLESFAHVDDSRLSREELERRIADYDVLVVRLGYRVDRKLLACAIRLKAVVTATTGLDHVDLDAARARGIDVLSLQGEREFLDMITATAEHAWALLLALVRRVPAAFASVLEGEWDRDRFVGWMLRDRPLGIVGYGRLGRMVGRFGRAFGMRVLAFDPVTPETEEGVEFVGLADLLRGADAVSLHVPLSAATERMIGAHELRVMKRGAWLVNTSRGQVIDEKALLRALESEHLGGVALDVLAEEGVLRGETLRIHPLVQYASTHDNLILTPHIGGATHESIEQTEVFMARKLQRWTKSGGPLKRTGKTSRGGRSPH